MHVGISKRKKWKKNIARSTKAAKKVQVFSFKTFFSGKPFLVYKKSLFFRVYFSGVTGEILEEYLDLVVTQNSADHFAGHGSKQLITVITCFYLNF